MQNELLGSKFSLDFGPDQDMMYNVDFGVFRRNLGGMTKCQLLRLLHPVPIE